MSATQASPSGTDRWGSGGAGLLYRDARVAYLLFNEGRRRAIMRVYGVSEEQSLLVTLVAVAAIAQAIRDQAARATSVSRPPAGDTGLGLAVLRDIGHVIAGDWSRETPLFSALVSFAVAGALVRPVLRASVRTVEQSSHRARVAFDHRYGHLIRRRLDRS